MIYALSTLRKEGDKLTQEEGFDALQRYPLIRTDRGSQPVHPHRRLRYPLSVNAIQEFVSLNQEWIQELSDINSDPASPNSIAAVLNETIDDNIDVVELDDLRTYAAPAFGITINRYVDPWVSATTTSETRC